MNGRSAISLSGTEYGRGELGVMNGIGMMLRLQAEAVEAVVALTVLAFERRGVGGGVELDAGLVGEDLHHASAL